LEAELDGQKDWHPGSDGKVLDLVHPSLFPLMYGKSRFLREEQVPLETCSQSSGLGETVPAVDFSGYEYAPDEYSTKCQWLPCDVSIDADGNARITSYINNLHPNGHLELYAAIEQVVSKAVPMWEDAVRSTLYRFEHSRLTVVGDGFDHDAVDRVEEARQEKRTKKLEGETFGVGWGDHGDDLWTTTTSDDNDDENDEEDEEEDEEDRDREECYKSKYIMVPEPEPYMRRQRRADDADAKTLEGTFSGNSLQVIVKLANIHLTPEKPEYGRGAWHIEVSGGPYVPITPCGKLTFQCRVCLTNTSVPAHFTTMIVPTRPNPTSRFASVPMIIFWP
jgi:hypothetical protein